MKAFPLFSLFLAVSFPAGMAIAAEDLVAEKFQKMQLAIAAEESLPDTAMAAASNVHPFWLTVEIAAVLLMVLALAVISIRLLKKLQGGMLRGSGPAAGDLLEVVETCHLGTHQRIFAVRMGNRIGIIGASKESMQMLHLLDESAQETLASRQSNPQAFSENLNRLLDRFKKPKKVSELMETK